MKNVHPLNIATLIALFTFMGMIFGIAKFYYNGQEAALTRMDSLDTQIQITKANQISDEARAAVDENNVNSLSTKIDTMSTNIFNMTTAYGLKALK